MTAAPMPGSFYRPRSWPEALEIRRASPSAVPIAGGTDLMVALNFTSGPVPELLDLNAVADRHVETPETPATPVYIGAGATFTTVIRAVEEYVPALATAARTVAAPQIRNRATLGGNIATASPAGDGLVPLVAADAQLHLDSAAGSRVVPIAEFLLGPKRTALGDDELIAGVSVPRATGPQQFAKLGRRNAMAISMTGVAVDLRPDTCSVAIALGAVGPTVLRAHMAERFLAARLDWAGNTPIDSQVLDQTAELAAGGCSPIDDHRGTAQYRTSAVAVLVRRLLARVWDDHRGVDTRSAGDQRCA